MHALLKTGAAFGTALFKKKLMVGGLIGLAAIGAVQVVNMILQRRKEKRRPRMKKAAHAPHPRAGKREMYHAPAIPTENLIRH